MKDDELLHKWIEGNINAEELKVFQLRPEYESLVDLYKNSEHLSAPSFDKEVMLKNIITSKKANDAPTDSAKVFSFPTWGKLAVAASLLVLLAVFFWPNSNVNQFATLNGEIKTHQLPDGSVFTLNAESQLSYDTKKWEQERKIKLTGEAFFEVEKGEKFTVETANGSVEVLGTHFNVWSRGQSLEVSCQEGRVAVRQKNGTELGILSANDALRMDADSGLEKWTTTASEKADWVKGIFKFRKVPLSRVLAELERQFDVQIATNDVSLSEIISCNFQSGNLDLALKTTLTPLGVQYKIDQDKKITIFK